MSDDQPSNLQTLWPTVGVFLLLALVMTLAFDALIEKRRNPNVSLIAGEGGGGTVVLQRNRFGSYLAPGRINGQPVTFLVDTGASTVAMSGKVARDLGLEPGAAITVQTAAGPAQAYHTWIDSIVLGGIRVDNVRGTITPAMTGDEVLLGMSFLRHVEFVQQGDQLMIRTAPNSRRD